MESLIVRTTHSCCIGFNSLQPGNLMESQKRVEPLTEILRGVSIPFKRETSWKVRELSATTAMILGFNSLQTGNLMERRWMDLQRQARSLVSIPFNRETSWKDTNSPKSSCLRSRFNSLQPGNLMERERQFRETQDGIRVSIPFNRETSWKVNTEILTRGLKRIVSIPFNRETSWKVKLGSHTSRFTTKFQFPSNGKPHGKNRNRSKETQ